ncbi:MAG TPA: DNA methyltransferase [Rickettsiales bacterium]|nr:DNA methyltransferase [Rickettsiales bacterium]
MHKIQIVPINSLKPYPNNARTHSDRQVTQIARSIREFGFNNPIITDNAGMVIAGHGRLLAAKQLGLAEVPVICLDHMSESQKKAYILADNKLAEKAGWDKEILKIELEGLLAFDADIDLTITGLETPEIDLLFHEPAVKQAKNPIDELPLDSTITPQVCKGDLWQLGGHRLYCGDSLQQESFNILMGDKRADLVFIDPPYNVAIDGHVCGSGKIKHAEFAYASGEMTPKEFMGFLTKSFELLVHFSQDGSLHYICMDWRHVLEISSAGTGVYDSLKNICVWNKQLGGMGSLYRSQHEFVFVFKHGKAPHVNNIELGKHGRYRTNIWDYPGVHANNGHKDDLKLHPTVKPVQMIADAIIDSSRQGSIILDSFAGSGSTLLAAEKTKRKAYVIEYEPHYCDVILYRYEKLTGVKPVLLQGGAHA